MDPQLRETEKLVDLFASLVANFLGDGMLAEAEAGEVTCTQLDALRYLARHSPNFVGHLSSGLAISYPAATKAVDRLVAKSLVDRQSDPHDRRKEGLTVTPEGLELLERVRKIRGDRLEAVLTRMEDTERKALVRGLRGFLTAAFLTDNQLVGQTCERCGSDCFETCVLYQTHVALYGEPIAP
ncbi:MAG: MarR family winged helix-turn-helix transcriptional regulator [Cyanobacteria bacterium REEB65]|nr:MarR family winged helix-turn-helix transcriptional regulator [Cyanobacteria bacterium REEB65]